MRDFFSLDGPFQKYGGMVADMVILSMMWFVLSLPVVTMGAATTALFFVSTRRIADREGYITSDFWAAFKANFWRATAVWMICLFVILVILANIFLFVDPEMGGPMFSIIWPAQFIFLFELLIMLIYAFPLLARFDMSVKEIFKSAFFMANRHLPSSLLCLAMLVAIVGITLLAFPPLLLVGPGLYAWLASYIIMRIFKKYRPEMDQDPMIEIMEIEARKQENRRRAQSGLPPLEEDEDGEEEDYDEDNTAD